MSLTRKKTAEDLNLNSTVKAVKRARAASSAAAANATTAAQNAALAAQNAAGVAQHAAQQAAGAAQHAAQNAAVTVTSAAQSASDAAQTAATDVSKNVKHGVYVARSWAAPRLESAADYTSNTVAPKVSSALRNTAHQISPTDTASSKRRVLTWSMLGASLLAALGAAAALVRYRYRTAIAADSETADEEVLADSSGSQAAPVNPDEPATAKTEEQGSDTSANGRVASSGW